MIKWFHEGNSIKVYGDKVKTLIVTDMHIRPDNFTGRKDYVTEVFSYLDYIVREVIANKIDIVIFIGDLLDDNFSTGETVQKLLMRLNVTLTTLARTCLIIAMQGNHELHHIHLSPFYDLVNITSTRVLNDIIETRFCYSSENSLNILNTPDRLIINDKQIIELFHFSDINKNYKVENKVDIALYHDSIITTYVLSYIRALVTTEVYEALAQNIKITRDTSLFANVSHAVFGDIHLRVGEFTFGECVCDMPGSVGRTQATVLQGHSFVNLPLFTIIGDNLTKTHLPVNLWSIQQSYEVDMVKIKKEKTKAKRDFKKAMETTGCSTDIALNIRTSKFSDELKDLCIGALHGKIDITEEVTTYNEFIGKYR